MGSRPYARGVTETIVYRCRRCRTADCRRCEGMTERGPCRHNCHAARMRQDGRARFAASNSVQLLRQSLGDYISLDDQRRFRAEKLAERMQYRQRCECGCGTWVTSEPAGRRRRYVDGTHRMRVWQRARRARDAQPAVPAAWQYDGERGIMVRQPQQAQAEPADAGELAEEVMIRQHGRWVAGRAAAGDAPPACRPAVAVAALETAASPSAGSSPASAQQRPAGVPAGRPGTGAELPQFLRVRQGGF